jgi:menaquinol-cytochrome c reductase iron-sulfur subunit
MSASDHHPPEGRDEAQADVSPKAVEPGAPRYSRRSFVIALMSALGAIAAAIVAVPTAAFVTAPGWLSTLPRRLLSETVSPVLRSKEWSSAGAVDAFTIGVPEYLTVDRLVVDGWVERVEPVGVYVLLETDARAVVMDPHCTHLGCPVKFASGAGGFLCPCHGGAFDEQGYPTSGPPPRRLDVYETKVEDGEVLFREILESKA